ncbi:AI-2E family transporter [Sphingobacterium psychroaquaticum]|uniref:AI-2E family transporter n=1 Tax=Sphingobacterium psychroaquaticum TaxID=561061 RepID=UPI00106D9155|nr:AI-2E family transporter [Sphingobacterium psychroaquaticum]QBQ40334.1 AI-2E family transporter [Sphingobacterium psychroaquaticum]
MSENNKRFPYSLDLASSLTAMALIIGFMYVTQSLLLPLLFSILISISLFPLAQFFERLRLGKAFASILAVIVAIAVISSIGWFIVHQSIIIGQDASSITEKVLSVLERAQVWIEETFGIQRSQVAEHLREQGNKLLANAGSMATATFGSIGNILAGAILVPLFSFFLLYYRDFFREFFFKAFKSVPQAKVDDTLNKIYQVVQSYLLGLVMVMGIVAVLNTIGLMMMGIDYAWFFGSLAALLMLLPYIGIAIGSILPALFALAVKDNALYAVGVIAWFQVVQFLEGNVITPNIVGSKVSINPLMAMIAMLLGGMLFGIAGLVIALPLTATIKVIFDAVPSMQAFGFLIGEPEKEHLKRNSTQELMMKWGIVRKPKTTSKIEIDVNIDTTIAPETIHVNYKEINESEENPYTNITPIDKPQEDQTTGENNAK